MSTPSDDPRAPDHICSDWRDVVSGLEVFPSSEIDYDEGDMTRTDWVFRGLSDSCFRLEPAIERMARSKKMPWLALEKLVALEFKSRARMHLSEALVPDPRDEFTWLAQMQHYGIPTRLLDFTYSPFVALYFAIREQRTDKERSHVRLWAIDAAAVNSRFRGMANKAEAEVRERRGQRKYRAASLHPADFASAGDIVTSETQGMYALVKKALLATGTRRWALERQGCVVVASPPSFNPRLASQQGVFLVNCAEGLNFCESLNRMMAPCRTEWCRRFDIAVEAVPEIERQLFRMNVHEQSLFPDMEGLAGFIRQKLRLHWR